jgi:hypothetical protein
MAITLSAIFTDLLLGYESTAHTASVADQFGGGTLVVYSGTAPNGANDSLTQNGSPTALATWTFAAASSWSAASGGSQNLDIPTLTVTASATGTATFFRVLNSGGSSLIQGTVATSGGDFNLSSTSITSGDNVTITGTPSIAWTVT